MCSAFKIAGVISDDYCNFNAQLMTTIVRRANGRAVGGLGAGASRQQTHVYEGTVVLYHCTHLSAG